MRLWGEDPSQLTDQCGRAREAKRLPPTPLVSLVWHFRLKFRIDSCLRDAHNKHEGRIPQIAGRFYRGMRAGRFAAEKILGALPRGNLCVRHDVKFTGSLLVSPLPAIQGFHSWVRGALSPLPLSWHCSTFAAKHDVCCGSNVQRLLSSSRLPDARACSKLSMMLEYVHHPLLSADVHESHISLLEGGILCTRREAYSKLCLGITSYSESEPD